MKVLILISICSLTIITSYSQPWKAPIRIATSTDGTNFINSKIFQDSSGVPCIIHWKGDTLICAFQWFRQPVGSLTWDRVAVKYSYDKGTNWTEPTPVIMVDMPANYQRPFDPTLVVFGKDSIRMYFSSTSKTMPGMLDSMVNTYSAKSIDGIHYYFEPNPRVDVADKAVIDPAVTYFKKGWHYTAPAGAPQEGARHYVSPDGIHFSAVPTIPSDMNHNWTGNLMLNDTSEMRFYGSGANIWYKSTENGGAWKGYVETNIKGGDPGVVRLSDGSYIMIYVGPPYITAVNEVDKEDDIIIYPNPATSYITIKTDLILEPGYSINSMDGKLLIKGLLTTNNSINIKDLSNGSYLLNIKDNKGKPYTFKFIIQH